MHQLLTELLHQRAVVAAEQAKLDALAKRCAEELCQAKPGSIVEHEYELKPHRKRAYVDQVNPVVVRDYPSTGTLIFQCYLEGRFINSRGEVSKAKFGNWIELPPEHTGQRRMWADYLKVVA